MSRRVAILQSSYAPWKGYFDLIASVDEFILLDEVEYSKNDWRNRNRIKTSNRPIWLTIPVRYSGRSRQRIDEVEVADSRWRRRHARSIGESYGRAPHGDWALSRLDGFYDGIESSRLSLINRAFIDLACGMLGIDTPIRWSTDLDTGTPVDATDRILRICRATRATDYLSGPSARAYLDTDRLERCGITTTFADYRGYPTYPQLHGEFVHEVSIIDLFAHAGPDASAHLIGVGGSS